MGREEENKRLKSELAHYRAVAESLSDENKSQRATLLVVQALTNTQFKEEDGRLLIQTYDLDLRPSVSFFLNVDDSGSVNYEVGEISAKWKSVFSSFFFSSSSARVCAPARARVSGRLDSV